MAIARKPISTEARRRVRELWSRLEFDATAIKTAIAAISPITLERAAAKNSTQSRHAASVIRRRLPARLVHAYGRERAWAFLEPQGDDSLVMMGIVLNGADRDIISTETFGLSFGSHCIGRYFERAGAHADPVHAMHTAHGALLRLRPDEGDELFELRRVLLPASAGAFIARPRPRSAASAPMAHCATYVDRDQLFGDQDDALAKWHQLLTANGNAT